MATLHTFGCSITQGFALPDTIQPVLDDNGEPLTEEQCLALGQEFNWEDVHLYKPSEYAWPQVLANQLGMTCVNHARRGACFNQIARQCAQGAPDIEPDDVVIVMWTYLQRLSLQWPARTSVPYCNIADPAWGWQTVILGFNRLFGLSSATDSNKETDEYIQKWIESSTKDVYLNPMDVYNRYYNSLVLQTMTDGYLRNTGARVIHLSVEADPVLDQLENARKQLEYTLRSNYTKTPDPQEWYKLQVDNISCQVLLDPSIPTAENDMHPSVTHHANFAEHIQAKYF